MTIVFRVSSLLLTRGRLELFLRQGGYYYRREEKREPLMHRSSLVTICDSAVKLRSPYTKALLNVKYFG